MTYPLYFRIEPWNRPPPARSSSSGQKRTATAGSAATRTRTVNVLVLHRQRYRMVAAQRFGEGFDCGRTGNFPP